MANKQLINAMRDFARYNNMDKHIIQMFSAFVIALKENTDLNDDDIEYILSQVQEEWNKSVNENYNIADKCAELYGIDVRRRS